MTTRGGQGTPLRPCVSLPFCPQPPAHLKMRQFLNWEKKRLEGWSAQMTHLPMASASAVVVATTSLVEGLMNTCV